MFNIKNQHVGFYLTTLTALLAIIAIIGYVVTIRDLMGTSLVVFILLALSLIFSVAAVFLAQNKTTGKFFAYGVFFTGALFAGATITIITNRIPWFMNIASSNDVPPIHGAFIFTVAACVIGLLVSLLASFFKIKKED
jgi:hypothetical protein